MLSRYKMFAHYNEWANVKIYAAAESLPDQDYRADTGAFFGSIHATLNHLVVTDRMWMRRFTGDGDAPASLDAILAEDLTALRDLRRQEDARIVAFVASLDENRLNAVFSYRPVTNPATVEQPLASALDHFFNHQTHHRGQLHAMLTRFGSRSPVLDLVAFQRIAGFGGVRVIPD